MDTKKREDKALFEFKNIMEDLLLLLGTAAGAQTGYLYWVNRSRKQFVLETKFTSLPNVMFQDRVNFEKSFLDRFKDITNVMMLEVGREIQEEEIRHYYNEVPVNFLMLIPFRNNGETVAITILETRQKFSGKELQPVISAYRNAHVNVLNTYLELTDLYEDENKWADYDASIEKFSSKLSAAEVLALLLDELQLLLPGGGATIALRGMEMWVTALKSAKSASLPVVGLMVEEKSMAHDALSRGETIFSMHFNQNPKRVASTETETSGATFAVPMMISAKRHAVVLAQNPNPLVFTEAIKHQIKNLVKIASLTIDAAPVRASGQAELFTTEYGNFVADLWQMSLQRQIKQSNRQNVYTWFGLIGIENISELRSKFRLNDLKKLQRTLVKALNPNRLGYSGLIGFHSDYVYAYLFVSRSEAHHEEWLEKNIHDLKNKLDLGDGRYVSVEAKAGSVKLEDEKMEIQQVISEAKKALDLALKKDTSTVKL